MLIMDGIQYYGYVLLMEYTNKGDYSLLYHNKIEMVQLLMEYSNKNDILF
ncbi:hypothetical protein PIROE2DRAFT_13031 [Piromyces sp. E2]|nr:hypothetical protein PIROE2DRAFT_13031 [Piromyces sp. E2]|eukprot:OUM61075.1 hypothetical protein PIROE2DRAFT_13031 [Piromyces sp. E2]